MIYIGFSFCCIHLYIFKNRYTHQLARLFPTESAPKWRILTTSKNNHQPERLITPHQEDGYNCGVFVAMMIDYYLSFDKLPGNTDFGTADMPRARLYIARAFIYDYNHDYHSNDAQLRKSADEIQIQAMMLAE